MYNSMLCIITVYIGLNILSYSISVLAIIAGV